MLTIKTTRLFLVVLAFTLATTCGVNAGGFLRTGGRRDMFDPNEEGPWPDCVDMTPEDCERFITKEATDVYFQVIDEGTMVTTEYVHERIRIICTSETGLVVCPPMRG